ncbi:adenyl-nucleotide exchange factor sse1 [Sorochytrium milnesiophthora]
MSVVGFDFGNMQSCIAVARNRGIDIMCNEVSNRFTPSQVSFGEKNRFIGEGAATVQLSNLPNTVTGIKRLVGRPFDDPTLEKEKKYLTVELVPTTHEVGVRVDYANEKQTFSATQVAAMYLAKLKQTTENEVKGSVVDVVVSVPGWFAEPQRKAMLEACEIAGLNCLRLINDTTAAALAYGITKTDLPEEKPRNVVFVDIGHSSTSIAVVAFVKGKLQVKGTAYNPYSGGRDLDQLLVDHFVNEFKAKYKFDVSQFPKPLHRLRVSIEKLKKMLSANSQAPLNIEALHDDRDVSSIITRAEFEAYAEPFLASISPLIDEALAKAGVSKDEVDCVETVGGTTRVPSVREVIVKYFGRDLLSFTINQDEAVARGAALMCAIISPTFRVRDFEIKDLAPYGVKLTWTPSQAAAAAATAAAEDDNMDTSADTAAASGNEMVVFHQASTMPSTKALTFYRRDDAFDIEARIDPTTPPPAHVQQWIGRYTVKGIPKSNDGQATTVKVKVKVNHNGMLQLDSAHSLEEDTTPVETAPMEVDGKAPADGAAAAAPPAEPKKRYKRINLTVIQGSFGMGKDEVNKAREQENAMAASDRLVFDTEVAKNSLEEYIYDARSKAEGVWNEYMSEGDKSKFSELLQSAEDWLYSEEGDEATKSTYLGKLDELKSIGQPAAERYRDADERPAAERSFRLTLSRFMNDCAATGPNEKYSHIAEQDIKQIQTRVQEKLKQLDEAIKKQNAQPKHASPVITSAQIKREQDDLERFATPILSRPKPAPPKPEEPAAGTTANGDAAAQEGDAKSAKKEEDVNMNVD